MNQERKLHYKTPPTTIIDKFVSQDARRKQALADQKRRRASKINSSRQDLDLFADLTIGSASDEEDSGHTISREMASFASILRSETAPVEVAMDTTQDASTSKSTSKKKNKKKRKPRGKGYEDHKPSQWADRCMYAELLEMNETGDSWLSSGDGLPEDLETGWVAVAPVPAGKRVLAVTYQTSGLAGTVPNTTLRSRLLGKSIIPPFPSSLPPLTILDCILDVNWRDNGVLHVLDVLQYKGQDVGDCETAFRFWWRDTRLAEIPRIPLPSTSAPPPSTSGPPQYRFPYPTTLVPVPYHTDTMLQTLTSTIIPLSRSTREISVDIPSSVLHSHMPPTPDNGMITDSSGLVKVPVQVRPDGMLLYIAQASYEPGTSPLSSWIPIEGYEDEGVSTGKAKEKLRDMRKRPLDLFEKLVKQRLARRDAQMDNAEMDMDI